MIGTFKILHCFRAPVGGLFRHVCDLAAAQAAMGHEVGLICDTTTGGRMAEAALRKLEPACALGITRVPMSRMIGLRDIGAYLSTRRAALAGDGADILHGHGAKGGAYARLVAHALKRRGREIHAFYTPHGGSLHYDPDTTTGRLFLKLEQYLAPMTDGVIFESAYSRRLFEAKVGALACRSQIIPNGLHPYEFYDVRLDVDPADFVFVGELRQLKGVDVYLQALAELHRWKTFKALVVGAGPDAKSYHRLAKKLNLESVVRFPGPMPARQAFARARCLVVPSRAESFPYIVLEAAAAQLPMILTNVGGIPDITMGSGMELIEPGNVQTLHDRMVAFLEDPVPFVEQANALQAAVSNRYTIDGMAHGVAHFYRAAGG
ncbi:MAG: glycosyltransferase family 4 protein [Methyloligellaceae bacterium]